jgi:hypothetical protein
LINNFVYLYGGAIFFSTYVSPCYIWKSNIFENNFAKLYGDNWASLPFRLVLTYKNISLKDFSREQILNLSIDTLKLQSNFFFNIEYKVWMVDQFFQPAFLIKET